VHGWLAKLSYAAVTPSWACAATALPAWIEPFVTLVARMPVTALPGLTPSEPRIVVGPVLVTVEPARTANAAALPRVGAV